MVMVLMSAWIPAPPELSEPAMARMRGGALIRSSAARLRADASHAAPWPASAGRSARRRSARSRGASRGSRRGLHRRADIVDDLFHLPRVVAFGHDADLGLGARLADHQPAAAVELRLALGNRGLDLRVRQRVATL